MSQELFATQTGSFSAELTRRALFAQYARTAANNPGIISGGLVSASDLQLTAPASGMTVNVGTGEAILGGSSGGAQGGYYARNTAQASLVIAAANPTNPRVDTVVFTAGDSYYGEPAGIAGGTNASVLQVVTGTATAGATLTNLSGAGAVPLSSLLLGYVLVPAASTNVTAGNISNVATVARPQIPYLIPTSQTAGYTAKIGDLVEANGTFTVTTPAAAKGVSFAVTNIGTGTVTVAAASGSIYLPLLGSGVASFPLLVQGASVTLTSDGTNWIATGSPVGVTQMSGNTNVNFSGATSASVTITHGLTRLPQAIHANNNNQSGGVNETAVWSVTTTSTTQVTLLGYIASGVALMGTVALYWTVVG